MTSRGRRQSNLSLLQPLTAGGSNDGAAPAADDLSVTWSGVATSAKSVGDLVRTTSNTQRDDEEQLLSPIARRKNRSWVAVAESFVFWTAAATGWLGAMYWSVNQFVVPKSGHNRHV